MKTNDLKQVLDQKVSSAQWTADNTWNVLNQVRKEKASAKRSRFPSVLVAAAALVILCAGVLAGTGRLSLFSRQDQLLPEKPVEIPLSQGGLVTVTDDTVPGPETTGQLPQKTDAPATEVPATEAPATEVPATETPAAGSAGTVASMAETPAVSFSLPKNNLLTNSLDGSFMDIIPELKPIGLVSENQDIRAELLYGLCRDREVWLVYSLEDLAGSWVNEKTRASLFPARFAANVSSDFWTGYIQEDYAAHKVLQYWHFLLASSPTPDSVIQVEFTDPAVELQDNVILPSSVFDQAVTTEGVDLPEKITTRLRDDNAPQLPARVLDYTRPLSIPLVDDIVLTGIGWINNQLHIQIHHTADSTLRTAGASYNAWSSTLNCFVSGLIRPSAVLGWDDTGDGKSDWLEYVLNCTPEDVELTVLKAEFLRTVNLMPGRWTFDVPAGSILADSKN